MFKTEGSHKQYQHFVQQNLFEYYLQFGFIRPLLVYSDLIGKFWITILDPIRFVVCFTYSEKGRKARDPVCMFRSLLLMLEYGEESITEWVKTLKAMPLFAILSGFDPDDVPGIGTFYDFLHRLWLCEDKRTKILKGFSAKPKKKKDKDERPHPDIVRKIVKRVIKYQEYPTPKQPYDLFNQILKTCFVLPSAEKGLLGDPQNLSISGDGTKIKTGARHYGKKVCECKEKCNCKRVFQDGDATWGFDSYRKVWVYGRTLYEITASDSPNDLPVFLKLTQCQRHDSVSGVYALDETRKFYPEFTFKEFQGDAAHDAYGIYQLLALWETEAIIDHNLRNQGNLTYKAPLEITPEGVPICAEGEKMTYAGFCRDRQRNKWRCPRKTNKDAQNKTCACSSSDYGRVIYTYPKDNLRHFTKIPRGSPKWKRKYNKRSASERNIKRKKIDYQIESAKARSTPIWFARCILTACCQHIDSRYEKEHESLNIEQMIYRWMNQSKQAA
ncbi:MAG: transposase [bacterium]